MKKKILTQKIENFSLDNPPIIYRNGLIPPSGDGINNFEFYNDSKEYITGSINSQENFKFDEKVLEEFPEYLAGWSVIITNTGLVCFYTESQENNNFVIYDMFDDDTTSDGPDTDTSFLSDIEPDISMLTQYNMFDYPLNVRKINFTDNRFTPEREYIYNDKYYAFFNSDGVNGNYSLDINTGFFEFESKDIIFNNVQYDYKPLFVFKIYNSDGMRKTENTVKILVDGEEAVAHLEDRSDGIYYIDLSGRKNFDMISVSLDNCGSGYLEVI